MLVIPKRLLCVTAACAVGTGHRYPMNSVLVDERDEGYFRLVATDAKLLVVVKGVSDPSPEDFLTTSGVMNGRASGLPKGNWCYLLPGGLLAETQRCLGRHEQALLVTANQECYATVTPAGAVTNNAVDVGRFPAYEQILPSKPALASITLAIKQLQRALKITDQFLAGDDAPTPMVQLLFYGKNSPLGLLAKHSNGETLDALLMPMT